MSAPVAALCARCHAAVLQVPAPRGGALAWRRPILQFGITAQDVYGFPVPRLVDLEDAGDPARPLLGATPEGFVIACRLASHEGVRVPPASEEERLVTAHVSHVVACPYERSRVPRTPGDRGECTGCGRVIHWLMLPSGRKAPLDPAPRTGTELSPEEAKAARGTPGFVLGLDVHGIQRPIREEGAAALLLPGPTVTVWVNHFATCPRADRFTRAARGSSHAG